MKMAGRMGVDKVTVQNLTIHAVDAERGLILVKGSVPGPKGALVVVRSAAKKGSPGMSDTLKVDVIGTSKKADLPAALFGVQANIPLLHQVVVAQQAAARQGTHATKTRGMVSGGGAKPWRQRAPAALVRARVALPSGPAVAPSTARSRTATPSGRPRR